LRDRTNTHGVETDEVPNPFSITMNSNDDNEAERVGPPPQMRSRIIPNYAFGIIVR